MTPFELINKIKEIKPNPFSDEALIGFINDVEAKLQRTVIKSRASYTFEKSASQDVYILPESVSFDNIEEVYLSGAAVNKIDTELSLGYMQGENNAIRFILDGDKSGIVNIVYIKSPVPHTMDSLHSLILPDTSTDIYVYYICSQIDLFSFNMPSYNNFVVLYNNAVEDHAKLLYENRAKRISSESCFKNLWHNL